MKIFKEKLGFLKEILIYAYIWQIPFSWRLIIDPSRSRLDSSFNEYMDLSLYLGEIILIIALSIHILEYIYKEKSIYTEKYKVKKTVFHMEHLFIFIMIILLLLNTSLSIDPALSLFSLLHLTLLFVFFFLFKKLYVSRGTKFLESIIKIFFFSIGIQVFIAFFQVINGNSYGLFFLNESLLSLETQNTAKSHLFSNLYLRGYGTFPHPNIFAAYAMLIILTSEMLSNLFHVKHKLIFILKALCMMVIILSQSKIFIFSAFLYFIYTYFYKSIKKFHMEHLVFFSLIFFIGVSICLIFSVDVKTSFNGRVDQYQFQLDKTNISLFGSGIGTYRLTYDSSEKEKWIYEPVHFTPLIIFSEIGLTSILFLAYLTVIFNNVPRETFQKISGLILFIILIFATDHYGWDIYQGMFMIVIAASLISIYIDKYNIMLYNNINIIDSNHI